MVGGWLLGCLLFSLFSLQVSAGDCNLCKHPIAASWTGGEPQLSCGQNNVTYTNGYCPYTLGTMNICLCGSLTGIQYAGPCGCPNNCLIDTNQGSCVNGTCMCNPGWTGSDCSQVDCSAGNMNNCGNHGFCGEILGVQTCVCDVGWTGADCTQQVISPPLVSQVFASTQYSSEDNFGNNHPIFNSSTIAQIKLFMDPAALEFLLSPDNQHSSVYQKATLWFDNGATSKKMQTVGVRLKGNSSRGYAKKTWKISFTEFDDDNEWDQIKKISLKGFQTDPAYLRDAMTTNVAYSMNVYIQRFGWADLSINNQTFGFYYINEEVNKQYLDSRFGTNDGPLYKCTANLTWSEPEVSFYKNLSCGDDPCYIAKTKEAEDYTQLRDLIAVLNLTPNDTFATAVPKVFDMDLFLRSFAWEVATGNWDGLRDSNNFYLFRNPEDQLWKYIRHDNDITFGQLPDFIDVATNDIYSWGDGTRGNPGRFLYDRVLAIDQFKFTFSQYLQQLFDIFYQFDEFSVFREIAQSYEQLITKSVVRDVPHYLDSGFTYRTFNNSFYQTLQKPGTRIYPGQVYLSFADFMSQRKASAEAQLATFFNNLGS